MRDEAIKLWAQKRQEGWRACPPQWIPQKPLRAYMAPPLPVPPANMGRPVIKLCS